MIVGALVGLLFASGITAYANRGARSATGGTAKVIASVTVLVTACALIGAVVA